MSNTLKEIILVDDHIIVRDGLKELIQKLGPYHIYREYNSGTDLVNDLPFANEPDLIIMDLSMPGMHGDEVVELMTERSINIPILILTLSHDEKKIIKLFRLGVRGYLIKDCTAAIMKEALAEIFRSGYYHNDMMNFALRAGNKAPDKAQKDIILEKLSHREKEFLKLICHEDEYTYVQIADIMNVHPRTVDSYRESIFSKFGIKSKTGLVLFLLKHNLHSYLG